MSERLSRRQRQILLLMREHGAAMFFGLTREFFWHVSTHGLIIKAYQQPEYFLARRKLIEKIEGSNKPGTWYKLTMLGNVVAARLQP